jgi:hypothetical protein
MQDSGLARGNDGMHGIEPESVEPIVLEPVQGVLDSKGANVLVFVIDCAAPWRVGAGEELRRDAVQIISFGAEVVVDDIEEDHQSARVCGIDQRLEILRPAVDRIRRIGQDTVITPVPAAWKI